MEKVFQCTGKKFSMLFLFNVVPQLCSFHIVKLIALKFRQ